jgi:hypothetical protein
MSPIAAKNRFGETSFAGVLTATRSLRSGAPAAIRSEDSASRLDS